MQRAKRLTSLKQVIVRKGVGLVCNGHRSSISNNQHGPAPRRAAEDAGRTGWDGQGVE